MLRMIGESLWFFLPAYVANQCPGHASRWKMPLSVPVSEKWLGRNKTWNAYYAAPAGALCTLFVQKYLLFPVDEKLPFLGPLSMWSFCVLGVCLGLGAALGDHAESFIKRRLRKSPGTAWWPWDQLDFAIGALCLSCLQVGWIGTGRVAAILGAALIFHPLVKYAGYRLGHHDHWK